MSNKPLKISEQAAVQMPMKTVASLIILVAASVFAYKPRFHVAVGRHC